MRQVPFWGGVMAMGFTLFVPWPSQLGVELYMLREYPHVTETRHLTGPSCPGLTARDTSPHRESGARNGDPETGFGHGGAGLVHT